MRTSLSVSLVAVACLWTLPCAAGLEALVEDYFTDNNLTNVPNGSVWHFTGSFNALNGFADNNNDSVNQHFTTSFAETNLPTGSRLLRVSFLYQRFSTNVSAVRVGLFDGTPPTSDGWNQWSEGTPARDWRGYFAAVGVDGSATTAFYRNDKSTNGILMLDMGPVTATGGDVSNSPYHTLNSAFADASWSEVATADYGNPDDWAPSSLVWSDNSSASSVYLDFGASYEGTTISFSSNPNRHRDLDNASSGGVWDNPAIGCDLSYNDPDGHSTDDNRIAVKIGSLPEDTYEVYAVSRNPYGQNDMRVWSFSDTNLSSFEASVAARGPGVVLANSSDSWVNGNTYAKYHADSGNSVTLDAVNSYLYIAADGTNTASENRGFLNAVQVVPASYDDHAFFDGTQIGAAGTTVNVATGAWRTIQFTMKSVDGNVEMEVLEGPDSENLTSLGSRTDSSGLRFTNGFNNVALFHNASSGFNAHIYYNNVVVGTYTPPTGSMFRFR